MANEDTIPMHADFPKWYREVGVDENRDRLQRRWTGVATLVHGMNDKGWEDCLRIVFRAKTRPSEDGLGLLRKAFKGADELFDMHGNDRELEVLCGACLAVLLERNDDVAAAGALAVTTAALNGARRADLPIDLAGSAETAIRRIAEINRKRPSRQQVPINLSNVSFAAAKEKLQQFDASGVGGALDSAAAVISASIEGLRKSFAATLERTDRYIAIQDEELEMLWWVLGECSESVGQPFKEISSKAQPLVFAAELADITGFLPGPSSAKGLLTRAGLKESKKLAIPEAINACDVNWLGSSFGGLVPSPLTQPIHFAISRRLETQDENSWIAGWASSCGIDEKQSLPPLALGSLFYRERLLSLFGGK